LIAVAASILLSLTLIAWVFRALRGPTLQDRALGVHGAALSACLLAAAIAVLARRAAWIDIALAVLIGDILLTVIVLRAFRLRSLQAALTPAQAPAKPRGKTR
jgi:multisubunit Na+/H+ antiporter MnhF subunit